MYNIVVVILSFCVSLDYVFRVITSLPSMSAVTTSTEPVHEVLDIKMKRKESSVLLFLVAADDDNAG